MNNVIAYSLLTKSIIKYVNEMLYHNNNSYADAVRKYINMAFDDELQKTLFIRSTFNCSLVEALEFLNGKTCSIPMVAFADLINFNMIYKQQILSFYKKERTLTFKIIDLISIFKIPYGLEENFQMFLDSMVVREQLTYNNEYYGIGPKAND